MHPASASCTGFVLLAALLAVGACENDAVDTVVRRSTVADSAGVLLVALPMSPNALATSDHQQSAVVLRRISARSIGLRTIGAIAELPMGKLALLDRASGQIVLLDSSGSPILRLASADRVRSMSEVLGIAAFGDSLVTLRGGGPYPLELRDPRGALLRAGGWRIDNRWRRLLTDGPRWRFGGDNESLADPARYVRSAPGGSVVVAAEPMPNPRDHPDSGMVLLLRLSSDLQRVDTAVRIAASSRVPAVGHGDREDGLMFGPRPIWDVGSTWIVSADGVSPEARVTDSRQLHMIVRWPSLRPKVRGHDRKQAALWLADLSMRSDTLAQRNARRLTNSQMNATYGRIERSLAFASRASEVSSVLAVGTCALIGGWRPDENLDGSASSYVVIEVERGRVLGMIRLPTRGARVRATGTSVHAAMVDSLGETFVESYRLPWPECQSRQYAGHTISPGGQNATQHFTSSVGARLGSNKRVSGENAVR